MVSYLGSNVNRVSPEDKIPSDSYQLKLTLDTSPWYDNYLPISHNELCKFNGVLRLGSIPGGFQEKNCKKVEIEQSNNNNGQLRIAMPPRMAHAKPPGPISFKNSHF